MVYNPAAPFNRAREIRTDATNAYNAANNLGPNDLRYGLLPSDKDYATQALTRIRRAEYDRYKDRFRPLESILFNTQGGNYAQGLGQKAGAAFAKGFDSSQLSNVRNLASYGLQMTPEQQRIAEQRRVIGQANAVNQATRQGLDASTRALGLNNNVYAGGSR